MGGGLICMGREKISYFSKPFLQKLTVVRNRAASIDWLLPYFVPAIPEVRFLHWSNLTSLMFNCYRNYAKLLWNYSLYLSVFDSWFQPYVLLSNQSYRRTGQTPRRRCWKGWHSTSSTWAWPWLASPKERTWQPLPSGELLPQWVTVLPLWLEHFTTL